MCCIILIHTDDIVFIEISYTNGYPLATPYRWTPQEQDYPALGSSPHPENFIPKLSIIQEIISINRSILSNLHCILYSILK